MILYSGFLCLGHPVCLTLHRCLTHKLAICICVTYDKWCRRSLWRQLKRFNGDSWQCLSFWASCVNLS